MENLTKRQSVELVKFIFDQHGNGLTKRKFTEVVLDCFEDISGFEGLSPPEATEIINTLWSIYRGKSKT
ncbi:MAG: hypothetical protein WCK81_06180 [Betaproteobacteria bacterium]